MNIRKVYFTEKQLLDITNANKQEIIKEILENIRKKAIIKIDYSTVNNFE